MLAFEPVIDSSAAGVQTNELHEHNESVMD